MTIRTLSDRILATVAVVGKPKESKFNQAPYRPVLFESSQLPDGGQHWKNMSESDAAKLRKGMKVRLWPVRREGRDTFDVELMDDEKGMFTIHTPTTSPNHHEPLSPEQRIEIGAYMDQMANLYGYAWELAHTKLGDKASEDTKRCMASSLYLSAQRRFGLAERVEFGGADAAVNCASPEKPGARLNDAQKPQSSVAKPTAQTGAQSRPVQPNLVNVPRDLDKGNTLSGSHWDVAG